MNKKNQNIALISTSPIMLLLALKLKKEGHKITIFDNSNYFGGAWAFFENNHSNPYKKIPKYTNIINPYNKKELKFTNKMNSYLKDEFKIIVKETKLKFKINYKYKKKFIYNFFSLINYAKKNLIRKKEFIYKIETLSNKKVKINNKKIFDKIFIPSFSGIKTIKIYQKKIFFPKYKEIISEHISVLAKKFKLKNFYYSQFFDNNFDRIKIEKIKKIYCLTARLNHSIKGIKLSRLKRLYLDKFVKKNDLIDVKISKFHNYYRNKDQLKSFVNIVKNTNIKYVDTTQFMCGFYNLRKILGVNKF